jgi:hemoglobin
LFSLFIFSKPGEKLKNSIIKNRKEENMGRKSLGVGICVGFFIVVTLSLWTGAQVYAQEKTEKSLYLRLGGYDAIAAVTDDFIGRLVKDPQFTRFFSGFSTDSLKRIRQLIVEQLCAAAGGPCFYTGRDTKKTHAGLGITERDWEASAKLLVASLDKFNVPEKEKNEVLAFVGSLKKDIVEK